jgi:hypothetical protein
MAFFCGRHSPGCGNPTRAQPIAPVSNARLDADSLDTRACTAPIPDTCERKPGNHTAAQARSFIGAATERGGALRRPWPGPLRSG